MGTWTFTYDSLNPLRAARQVARSSQFPGLCPVHRGFIAMSGRVQQPHLFRVHHLKTRAMFRMEISRHTTTSAGSRLPLMGGGFSLGSIHGVHRRCRTSSCRRKSSRSWSGSVPCAATSGSPGTGRSRCAVPAASLRTGTGSQRSRKWPSPRQGRGSKPEHGVPGVRASFQKPDCGGRCKLLNAGGRKWARGTFGIEIFLAG